jgi:hypothetical protein
VFSVKDVAVRGSTGCVFGVKDVALRGGTGCVFGVKDVAVRGGIDCVFGVKDVAVRGGIDCVFGVKDVPRLCRVVFRSSRAVSQSFFPWRNLKIIFPAHRKPYLCKRTQ